MLRDLYQTLEQWKHQTDRKPLILRGARQVGKSWLVRHFGRSFDRYVEINFEIQSEAKTFFEGGLEINDLINKLSIFAQQKIIPGQTLLFIDEVQECPRALIALRLFKEQYPQLHVIAAGSLIDFALEKIGVPVGRVQFLYLYPLSFNEFLCAIGRKDLREYISTCQTDPIFHRHLLNYLKIYMWLGGMPAVINAWTASADPIECQKLQDEIIIAYQQDFQKYAAHDQLVYLEKVFSAIPQQLGAKFKYSNVDSNMRSNPLKCALNALKKAGIAQIVHHSSGQVFPLAATKNERMFKVFFFDIGLAQRLLNLDAAHWITRNIEVRHLGGICEQLVAQEYIAYQAPHKPAELYYWHKEAKSSNAEIDFLFVKRQDIVPVEVKSQTRGGFKSLHLFLDTHPHSLYGLTLSEKNFSTTKSLQHIPLYGVYAWLHAQ